VRIVDLDRLTSLSRAFTQPDAPPAACRCTHRVGYPTRRPDPTQTVSLVDQARWLFDGEQIAAGSGPCAASPSFCARPSQRAGRRLRVRWVTTSAGLRFVDGRSKRAHASFSLALVACAPEGFASEGSCARVRATVKRTTARSIATAPGVTSPRLGTRADGTFDVTVTPQQTFRLERDGRHGAPAD
jgi:hypothetical protein